MSEIFDLIIIGSGPAGLGAGIYAKRARLNVLLIDKGFVAGGQVISTYEVDNYLGLPGVSGMELAEHFETHANKLEVPVVRETVKKIESSDSIKTVVTNKNTYPTKTVLIATGARHRMLHVPGEEELTGMGVSYCATCDGAFFKDKTVVVVGGGDVAVEDAIFLARGCQKVYVVHRRNEFRSAKVLQERLFETGNVEVIWDTVLDEIIGSDMVTGARIHNVKTGEERILETDGIFIAVGILPNTEVFEGVADMDAGKYLIAGEDCKTSEPGIFVAGDARTKPLRQIVTAVADGANAVSSVQEYLIQNSL